MVAVCVGDIYSQPHALDGQPHESRWQGITTQCARWLVTLTRAHGAHHSPTILKYRHSQVCLPYAKFHRSYPEILYEREPVFQQPDLSNADLSARPGRYARDATYFQALAMAVQRLSSGTSVARSLTRRPFLRPIADESSQPIVDRDISDRWPAGWAKPANYRGLGGPTCS